MAFELPVGANSLEETALPGQDWNVVHGTIDEAIAHAKQNLAGGGGVHSMPF